MRCYVSYVAFALNLVAELRCVSWCHDCSLMCIDWCCILWSIISLSLQSIVAYAVCNFVHPMVFAGLPEMGRLCRLHFLIDSVLTPGLG